MATDHMKHKCPYHGLNNCLITKPYRIQEYGYSTQLLQDTATTTESTSPPTQKLLSLSISHVEGEAHFH